MIVSDSDYLQQLEIIRKIRDTTTATDAIALPQICVIGTNNHYGVCYRIMLQSNVFFSKFLLLPPSCFWRGCFGRRSKLRQVQFLVASHGD